MLRFDAECDFEGYLFCRPEKIMSYLRMQQFPIAGIKIWRQPPFGKVSRSFDG